MTRSEKGQFRRTAWINLLGNVAKILVEGTVGLLFGSLALLADAAHSFADVVTSVVVLRWGDQGYIGPDINHPHGHSRFEPMTAFVVGSAIILMGAFLLIQSIQGLLGEQTVSFDVALFVALLFAILLMAVLYRYTMSMSIALDSTALRALAIDCRNDVFTSMAALLGITGVFFGYDVFDSLAGGAVSLLVISQGWIVARENLEYLLGRAAPKTQQESVRNQLLAHPDVVGVHDLVAFYEGTTVEVEAHVEVDGEMSLRRAHEIESELMQAVRGNDWVGDVHVHLDPSGVGEWKDAEE